MTIKKLALSALALLTLSACAEVELASHVVKKLPAPQAVTKSKGTFKVGTPYRVAGKQYRPKETYRHIETGKASWYGPNFHGKRTANGETFNMYDMTAAHKTLQMPSIIKVTNLENGRTAILRVNDRGPFSKRRVLDVSKKASEVLGFKNQGTAQVKIEVLENESRQVAALAKQGLSTRGMEVAMAKNPGAPAYKAPAHMTPRPVNLALNNPVPAVEAAPAPVKMASVSARAPLAPPNAISAPVTYVQAGAFKDAANAERFAQSLKTFGDAHVKPRLTSAGNSLYRVRFGPMKAADANILVARLGETHRIDAIAVSE